MAERLEREREAEHAGSQGTDEEGRRLDTRGFKDAKKSLGWLSTIQMGQWRNHGRYGEHLEAMAPGKLGDKQLHGRSNIHMLVAEEGREFRAWRSTPSDFCFGIAGRGGPVNEWRYAGMGPPPDDLDAEEWRGSADPWPLDW